YNGSHKGQPPLVFNGFCDFIKPHFTASCLFFYPTSILHRADSFNLFAKKAGNIFGNLFKKIGCQFDKVTTYRYNKNH
ncbi:MAG: hypothetical protein AAGU12_14150, partial [Clostridiales bacterium]